MARGDLVATIPYALAIAALSIFVLSASDQQVVAGTIATPPNYLTLVRGRAGMTLLGLLGYGAGVGGHGVWLARVTGSGAGLAGGMVLYLMSTDLVAVSLVAALSIWLLDVEQAAALRWLAPVLVVVLVGLKLMGPHELLLGEARLPAVFRPWVRIGNARALAAVALRTANIYLLTLCVWGAAAAFGLSVPLGIWMAYFPVVLVVGSMPVNVAGFGAVQGAWLLFAPWASSAEQVLAFSVLWHLVIAVAVLLRGLPFVRSVAAEIAQGTTRATHT
jgi:hypothetical protein